MATFQLSEDEFIRGSLAFVLRRRTAILLVIGLVLISLSQFFNGRSLLQSVAVTLIAALAGSALIYLLARRRLKKIFREQQSLGEVMNVTIDDQQLSYSWARGSYILPWANVRRGLETRNFFILYESSAYGRMLPKRALSEEEKAIVRKNIASNGSM
jgi:hypothetical protein